MPLIGKYAPVGFVCGASPPLQNLQKDTGIENKDSGNVILEIIV